MTFAPPAAKLIRIRIANTILINMTSFCLPFSCRTGPSSRIVTIALANPRHQVQTAPINRYVADIEINE